MTKFLAVIFFIFACNLQAIETCTEELKSEIEIKITKEDGLKNLFHVIWTISQYRKEAFEEKALNLVSSMDEGIYYRADLALDLIELHPSPDYKKLLDAFEQLFEDTSYYDLTWTDEQLHSVNAKLALIRDKLKHNKQIHPTPNNGAAD